MRSPLLPLTRHLSSCHIHKSDILVSCAHDFAGACALLLCAVSPSERAAVPKAVFTVNTLARTVRSKAAIYLQLQK